MNSNKENHIESIKKAMAIKNGSNEETHKVSSIVSDNIYNKTDDVNTEYNSDIDIDIINTYVDTENNDYDHKTFIDSMIEDMTNQIISTNEEIESLLEILLKLTGNLDIKINNIEFKPPMENDNIVSKLNHITKHRYIQNESLQYIVGELKKII